MALTSRDVLLVLRAKDEASAVIRRVGGAFDTLGTDAAISGARMMAAGSAVATMGAGMTAMGIGLLAVTKSFVDSSMDYRQQAALTLTQVDGLNTSVEGLADIGRRVANEIPVPFEELQGGLYDIFSSMETDLAGAERILTGFSRGAVAGQVSLQAAGRATIAIMNAYQLQSHEIDRVMDVQFQLVRKGVGTYEEFAGSIGMALPAANRAGQGIEELSGMLAFMTRNGLSAERAATSAGRALETLAHPKVIERMEAFGVSVTDSTGAFRDIDDIVGQLSSKMANLTDPEKAAVLQDMFQGAGNSIQARRFWDLAIRNADDLSMFVDDMYNSKGAMGDAYDIMFAQPQTQVQLFNNKLDILKTTMGDGLLPVIDDLLAKGIEIVDWFNALNPETQTMIAQIIGLAGVFATLAGGATIAAGSMAMFIGAIQMVGGIMTLIGYGTGVLLIIAALAAAAYLVYSNWDKIKPFLEKYWPIIQAKLQEFADWVVGVWQQYWPGVRDFLIDTWNGIVEWFQTNWPKIKATILDVVNAVWTFWQTAWPKFKAVALAVWEWILDTAPKVWDVIKAGYEAVKTAVNWMIANVPKAWNKFKEFGEWLWSKFGPGIEKVWASIKENFIPIIQGVIDIMRVLWERVMEYWPELQGTITKAMEEIWSVIQRVWPIIWETIKWVVDGLILAFQTAWPIILAAWNIITTTIANAVQIIRGWIDIIAGIMTGDWSRVWDGVKRIVSAAWDQVVSTIGIVLELIWELIKKLPEWAEHMWNGFKDISLELLKLLLVKIGEWFWDLMGYLAGKVQDFWDKGWEYMSQLWDAMQAVWDKLLSWVKQIPGWIVGAIGFVATLLYDAGKGIINGLWAGAKWIWLALKTWVTELPGLLLDALGFVGDLLYDAGKAIIQSLWNGMKDVWGEVKGWLGGLGDVAVQLKGPPQADAVLLENNGKLIMQGLRRGMQDEWLNTEAWLSGLGPGMNGSIGGPVEAGSGGGTVIQIQEGAVKVMVESVASPEDADRVRTVVEEALRDVLYEMRD